MKIDQAKIDTFKRESGAIATIQELLRGRDADFDAAKTIRLVRHLDKREKLIEGVLTTESLDSLYRFNNELFLKYQKEQNRSRFQNVDYIVSFLGEERNKARFIGVYRVGNRVQSPYRKDDIICEMEEVEAFKPLKDKIIIDWGISARSWCQIFETRLKPIVRIEEGFEDSHGVPFFKGYADTVLSFKELKAIINSSNKNDEWFTALTSVNCIYLITDKSNGKHYVGKTSGKNGIWQRWEEYVNTNGHGGNVRLKSLVDKDELYAEKYFQWSILEVLPLNITPHQSDSRENIYKTKLMSRHKDTGYNEN